MSAKFIFLLLAVFLLKCSFGEDAAKGTLKSINSYSTGAEIYNDFLLKYLLRFTLLHSFIGIDLVFGANSSIAETYGNEQDRVLLQESLAKITEFDAKLNSLNLVSQRLAEISDIVAKYNTTGVTDPKPEVVIIENNFKRNGVPEIIETIESENSKFYETLCNFVNRAINSTTEDPTNLVECDAAHARDSAEYNIARVSETLAYITEIRSQST